MWEFIGHIPWTAATGVTAWLTLAFLFVNDRIRTTKGAQSEIDRAYKIAEYERVRADKSEEKMIVSLEMAAKCVYVVEKWRDAYEHLKKQK